MRRVDINGLVIEEEEETGWKEVFVLFLCRFYGKVGIDRRGAIPPPLSLCFYVPWGGKVVENKPKTTATYR